MSQRVKILTKKEKEAYEKLKGKFDITPKNMHTKNTKNLSGNNPISYVIGILRQPMYTKRLAITTIIFFVVYSFLYGIWRIPVVDFGINRMTEVGIVDYTYLLIISILTGTIVSLFKFEKMQNIKSSKLAGGGGFAAAIFAGVCPVCQGIQVLALGSTIASIPLVFLVPYIGLIQIITIFILGLSLYLKSNTIFNQTCIACKVKQNSKFAGISKRTYL